MGQIANFFGQQKITLALQQKQQMLALDAEFETCKLQMTVLKAENLQLRAEVNPLKREIDRLKNQLQDKTASVHKLEQTEIDMLTLLSKHRRGLKSAEITQLLGLHPVRTEHFLRRLLDNEYIDRPPIIADYVTYFLADRGNAYLVENDLVP